MYKAFSIKTIDVIIAMGKTAIELLQKRTQHTIKCGELITFSLSHTQRNAVACDTHTHKRTHPF